MLQQRITPWDVAGVLGTSEDVIRRTYGHHSVEHLRNAVDDVWSRRPLKATVVQKRAKSGRKISVSG